MWPLHFFLHQPELLVDVYFMLAYNGIPENLALCRSNELVTDGGAAAVKPVRVRARCQVVIVLSAGHVRLQS